MTEQAISPLRRRMIEDMSIRKFAAKTQHDYVQRVKDFAAFLGRSPDTAKSEDVRRFRLHLTSISVGTPKINVTVSALRFFFKVTLDRPDLAKHLSFMHEPRRAPVVLSLGETRAVVKQMTLAPIADKITCPFLIVHGENDRQIPLWHAEKAFAHAVNSPGRELKIFQLADGGAEHCGADNGSLVVDYIADWAADKLGAWVAGI